mmetsp:Transcript_70161/g.81811  ORF Transcript_70161/g.81811 Transcript_70161/m.81811 type:complete len:212 (+) Transcript_70161:1-636(+)
MMTAYIFAVLYSALCSAHDSVKSAMTLVSVVSIPFFYIMYPLQVLWWTFSFLTGSVLSMSFGILESFVVGLWRVLRSCLSLFSLVRFSTVSSGGSDAGSIVHFWNHVRPVKNFAKAVYDGIVHVGVSLARREASIRRWYTAKAEWALYALVYRGEVVCSLYVDVVTTNWILFRALYPSYQLQHFLLLVLTCLIVLAWMTMLMEWEWNRHFA